MFECRKSRLLRLIRERKAQAAARKLRAAQVAAHTALGSRALVPHGGQRSTHFFHR